MNHAESMIAARDHIAEHDLYFTVIRTGFQDVEVGVLHLPTRKAAAASGKGEIRVRELALGYLRASIAHHAAYYEQTGRTGPATCDECRQVMSGTACTDPVYQDGDKTYQRVPYPLGSVMPICGDCATPAGGLHHPGCDQERCPLCGGQLIGCPC